ncbi:MAG: hypothetical protein OHK0029_30830 [Armatimonadaceae bacterium]
MKFSLLLVDANIIIELFRLGIWETFITRCDVHLSETVLNEARFYEDDDGQEHSINLAQYQGSGAITVHDVDASQLAALYNTLGANLLEKMDAGEAELLCVLENASVSEQYLVCSADAVIYRYLGATYRTTQGISLEEVLGGIGMTRKLNHQFSKRFRDRFSQLGFEQGFTGQARQP